MNFELIASATSLAPPAVALQNFPFELAVMLGFEANAPVLSVAAHTDLLKLIDTFH